MYSLIHDSENSLGPYITDLFEREANVFAAESLFQGARFSEEARQYDFGMKVPLALSDRYGASVYSTFRRYVTTSSNSCCVIVLEPAVMGEGKEFSAVIRRTVVSETFNMIFAPLDFGPCIHHRHYLAQLLHVGRKMTGRRSITIFDRNGTRRRCSAEAFNSKHHMFVLIKDNGPAPTILLP